MILEIARTLSGDLISVEDIKGYNGIERVLKVGRSNTVQSMAPIRSGTYFDALRDVKDVSRYAPSARTVPGSGPRLLLFGVAGGSFGMVARDLNYGRIVGVERDPEILRLAKRWFYVDTFFDRIILGDCFDPLVLDRLLREEREFDVIVVDIFDGVEVSSKIYSDEFIRAMAMVLAYNGIIIINCLSLKQSKKMFDVFERNGAVSVTERKYGSNIGLFVSYVELRTA